MPDIQWERMINRFMEVGVTVLTGAGASTDSGLPDFRGRAGLWKDADLAELLTAEGASGRFEEFTAFCKAALREVLAHKPNMIHYGLADLQRAHLIDRIVTTNVDGYHQDAGAEHVLEVHGSLRRISCLACAAWATPAAYLADGGETCPCGGRRRPEIVLFGESLQGRFLVEGIETIGETKLLIAIGTRLVVMPVALMPAAVVRNGGKFAVLNGEPTAQDDLAEFKVFGPIGVLVHDLYDWVSKFNRRRNGLLEFQELASDVGYSGPL